MGIISGIKSFFGGGGKNPIEVIADVADRFITTKEEKHQWTMTMYDKYIADKQDARKRDSWIRPILTIVFVIAYFALTYVIFNHFFAGSDLTEPQLVFVSTIFGTMNAKIGTIFDFEFGSSKESFHIKK